MPWEGARRGPISPSLPPSSASTPPRPPRLPPTPPPGLPVPHRQRTASGALPRYRSRTWRLLAVRQKRRPARSGRPTQRAPPAAHGRGCGDILGRNLAHPCVRQAGHPARRSARGNGRRYAGPSEIFRSGDRPRAGVRKGGGRKRAAPPRKGPYGQAGMRISRPKCAPTQGPWRKGPYGRLACACGPAGRGGRRGGGGAGGGFTPRPRRRRLEAAGRGLQGMKAGQNYFRGRRDAPAWQAGQ